MHLRPNTRFQRARRIALHHGDFQPIRAGDKSYQLSFSRLAVTANVPRDLAVSDTDAYGPRASCRNASPGMLVIRLPK